MFTFWNPIVSAMILLSILASNLGFAASFASSPFGIPEKTTLYTHQRHPFCGSFKPHAIDKVPVTLSQSWPLQMADDFVDAEFEPVLPERKKTRRKKKTTTKKEKKESPTNLIDISLSLDDEIKNTKVPFVSPDGKGIIDCKLAFIVELDGQTYGIGTPHATAVAIMFEDGDDEAYFLDPDDDSNTEVMEIIAARVQNDFGEDIKLKRTPRTLTIEGDLDKHTTGFEDAITGGVADLDMLLDNADEDEESFHKFMKEELGDDYMDGISDQTEIDPDFLKLFDIPGIGTMVNDEEAIKSFMKELETMEDVGENKFKKFDVENDTGALKLCVMKLENGKGYTLLKLLQPVVLVGKEHPTQEGEIELLTAEESELVIPRLEQECKSQLEAMGISLPTAGQ
jgi:hypothetical protein